MDNIDIKNLEKRLACCEVCFWITFIREFMGYDIPEKCDQEKQVREWVKKLQEDQLKKEQGF